MIKNVTDSLQRLYDAFIDEPDDWFFFLGLAEYMQYARINDLIIPIIQAVTQEMHDFDKKIKDADKTLEQESLDVYKIIQNRIEGVGIGDKRLSAISDELEAHADGRIQSTATKGECLHDCVKQMIEVLRQIDQDCLVKEFFVPMQADQKLTRSYKISKSLEKLEDLRRDKEQSKRTEVWGSYWELERARWTIKDGLEFYKQQSGLRGSLNRLNASMMLSEVAEIERRVPNRRTHIFKKDQLAFHARRFHNFLRNTLSQVPDDLLNTKTDPTYKNGILRFDSHEIEIRKPEKHALVLDLLFENVSIPVDADAMFAHVYEEERGKGDWKKLYNLIDRINDKIGKQTGVYDLIKHNKQHISLNTKYLL